MYNKNIILKGLSNLKNEMNKASGGLFERLGNVEIENGNLQQKNKKLEQALDEIENILNGVGEMACYSKSMCLYEEDIEDILKIIQKAKGDVKNEN